MSTLNSFFRARKSRNTSINKEKTLKCVEDETKQQFAAQIPQPIYEVLPKPQTTMKTGSRNNVKKKNSQDKNKNSILYYLSPFKNITHTTEEAAPLCQIRHNIPANYVWNLILEEFDPQSQSNQFEGSPCPSPTTEKADLHPVNEMTTANSRRRKLEQEEQDTYRCVRIRTVGPPSSVDIFCIENYLFEDIDEDLSRPIRNRHTFRESSDFYMEMLESLAYPE